MNNTHGIIVFGLNGSGKTTLGRELARILNFKHMDHEDYYFRKSEIPYTDARSYEECLNLIVEDIEKYGSFVISACTGDFDEKITQFYKLGVYIAVPAEIRMKRIEQREYDKFGNRVCKGGDLYKQQLEFRSFAASRSLTPIEEYAKTLKCPVIRVDGTIDWRENAVIIAERFIDLVK